MQRWSVGEAHGRVVWIQTPTPPLTAAPLAACRDSPHFSSLSVTSDHIIFTPGLLW